MKIAKRVLAVVMAIAMIAGLSAMAFAADGTFNLVASAVNGGKATVTLYLDNCAGLESADIVVSYDPAKLTYKGAAAGSDANAATAAGNTYMGMDSDASGKISYSFFFVKQLADTDPAHFEAAVFTFELKDGVTEATVTIESTGDAAAIGTAATIKATTPDPVDEKDTKKDDEKDTKKDEKDTKKGEKSSDKSIPDKGGKKPAPKGPKAPKKGNKNTGDNMALAAAGAVVVLAGAAFVISKKKRG